MHPGNAPQTTTNLSAEVQFMNQMLMNPQLWQQLQHAQQQQAQQQQAQQQQQQQQQQQLLLQALQNAQGAQNQDSRALQEVITAMSSQAGHPPSTSAVVTTAPIGELTVDTTQPPAQPVIKSNLAPTSQAAEDHTVESQQLAAEKAEVSDCLEATEKNIKKNDMQIETLTKRKQRFLQVANEEDDVEDETVEEPESEAQAIPSFQHIIDENVKRKNDLEATFPPHLRMPEKSTPLYLEPCDVPGMKELAIRQIKFAPQLRAYIRRRTMQQERNAADWEEEYRERYCDWYHKDHDNQIKADRQLKEMRWRQIFESTFKELSKQRGDKERQSRVENRLEYLAVTMEDQDAEKKKRNAAVVPPMMHCQVSRRNGCLFRNENHIQSNVALREKRRINAFEATWSDQDLAMFKNRLKLVGKNFANIAMFFPEKSVKDCVQCYYLLIKKLNKEYKSMLPKTKRNMKKKYRPPVMPTPAELAKYQQNPDAESSTGAPIVPDVKCSKCHQKLETNQVSIRVTRAFADAYGKEKKGIDVQICPKCHEAEQRVRSGRCLVKDCFASNKKLKPTKILPARWKQMDERQKAFLLHDMGIPRDITKTCHNCNKKIIKRLEQLLAGELDDQILEFENNLAWDDNEVANLLHLIEEMGTDDWEGVAEHMEGRDAEECRIQWTSTRKPVDVEEAHPSEEDEEEAEDNEKENGIDETMLEEDTLDVPDEEVKTEIKEEIKPEIIELSPDPMDTTTPGPALLPVDIASASTAHVDAIPSTAKIGSITAGTPLRPSSVTILDSTPQPGPSNALAAGPPGTAPPQSSSARATPQGANASFGQPVEDVIRKLIPNLEDQKKIMQTFAMGIGQANNLQVNPANPYVDALRQNAAGSVPPAVLAELQKMEQERIRQQQQQQQQADAQRQAAQLAQVQSQAAQAQILIQQIGLLQQRFGTNPQEINRMIQMCGDPMAAQLLHHLQTTQQQQQEQPQQPALGQMPKDLIGKFEYSIKHLEYTMNDAVQSRRNLALHFPTAPASAVQDVVNRIQESFQQPYRLFTNCKQEIETMIRKLQQDIVTCKAKERNQTEQVEHLENEMTRLRQQLCQLQVLAQQPQLHMLMPYQNLSAVLGANMQAINVQATTIAAQVDVAKKELQMTTASKQKLTEQLATYEQVRARGNSIPPTLTAIYEQVAARATEELNSYLARGGAYPQTTMAQLAQQAQQQQQLLLQQHQQQILQQFQQQQQQQNQQLQTLQKQQAAQAASAAAAQKLAQQQQAQQQQQQVQPQQNLPVRKDNTWVAEMEKQTSRPSMAPPNRNSILNTVGKKVIGEELAAQQQMASPSTAQHPQPVPQQPQQPQPAPAAGPAEPIKRKSGVETVYMDKVSAKSHPHMRRPGSPGVVPAPIPALPGNPLAVKPPTSRTGTTPLAIHTSMPGMDAFYSSPAAPEKNPADFVSRLRLPTQEQQSFPFASGLTGPKEPEVHRKTGMVRLPEREEAASSYSDFPFVICPTSLERTTVPSRSEASSLGASQQQLVSPGVLSPKAVSTMTLDNSVPSTSVGDVAHGVQTKPAMANGLLGEIEPMSPDSPKPAAISPAKLGGDRPHSGEGRLYSMMDDVFFEDDSPVFRPISPNSCLYKEPFLDSPLEDISSDDEPAVQMDSS